MEEGFYHYILKKTESFVFSDRGKHSERVRRLVTETRKMAVHYYYGTPKGFSKVFDLADWKQLAMITFFECVECYDQKRPFDNFIRFKVPKRLEDQRRKLYRQNPKTDSDNGARGEWIFSNLSESIERKAERKASADQMVEPEQTRLMIPEQRHLMKPDQHYLMREARKVLLLCVRQMGKIGKMLFDKHEFEAVSYKKLYKLVGCAKSISTFKRCYKKNIFNRVKECVQTRLAD